jgi:hypothetical protein
MAPVAEAEEEACLISKEVAHVLAVLAMRNNPMKEDSLKVRESLETYLGEMGAVRGWGEEEGGGRVCAAVPTLAGSTRH